MRQRVALGRLLAYDPEIMLHGRALRRSGRADKDPHGLRVASYLDRLPQERRVRHSRHRRGDRAIRPYPGDDGPARPDQNRNIASSCLARAIFAVSGKCRHSIN